MHCDMVKYEYWLFFMPYWHPADCLALKTAFEENITVPKDHPQLPLAGGGL